MRPPGLLVFAAFVVLLAFGWWLFADRVVERSVESTGEMLVGARVELESADVRPSEGSVSLTGLTVANPDRPMKNLFEADVIVGDVMLGPLLQKKVVVQRLVVTGVRFGTDRETSGALENPDPEAGALWREMDAWADAIDLPELSLDGLRQTVRTEAIHADSLATVRYAKSFLPRADSLRTDWESRLSALDPRTRIDSLTVVVEKLEAFRLTPLSAVRVPGLIREGRDAAQAATSLQTEVEALDASVRSGLATMVIDGDQITSLRTQDLAYARGLLNIPSFDAPTISPALFGQTAIAWLRPVLYWANAAERYLPPGLDPRNRPGPDRARARGTTFEFRQGAEYPAFLLQDGEIGVELGGSGATAGTYTALLRGLSSAPALSGQPMEITLGRVGTGGGPDGIALAAVLDHTGDAIRDSVSLSMAGLALPDVDLGRIGGTLGLGRGLGEVSLRRTGDQIAGQVRWTSDQLTWTPRTGGIAGEVGAQAPAIGSRAWAGQLMWRTLTGMTEVDVEIGVSGAMRAPSLTISSNVGQAVAASFRTEMGREIDAAEARLRAEVDGLIQPVVADARGRVDALTSQVGQPVSDQRAEVEALRSRLEARIADLVGRARS